MISANGYSILIVDDERGMRHGLEVLFKKNDFKVYTSGEYNEAIKIVNTEKVDIAILDIMLKNGRSGIELFKKLRKAESGLIAIMITGYASVDTAVLSIKEGASDYVTKPLDNKKLLDTVYKNLELRALKSENTYLKNEILKNYMSYNFITANRELKFQLEKADKIKNSGATVLINGESGTGKEVLARYIHFTSIRKAAQFVSINCAALSENLLLSELFGHEKGAFTGAVKRKIGKFEIADRGTLFLDEIGDMSPDTQAKLLRVLETNSFERVGGIKRINVNVRIIAATNKDLQKLIKEGKFREDLYYRINVVDFTLSPLRARKEDIPLLVNHFIKLYNKRYNKKVKRFDEASMDTFLSYRWPGNVRELSNTVNQAVLLNDGEIISLSGLKKSMLPNKNEIKPLSAFSEIKSLKETSERIKEHYEKMIIEEFLNKNNNNKSKTARELNITRKTLSKKIEMYKL